MTQPVATPAPLPRLLAGRPVILRALVVLALAGVMGLASQLAIPMDPVPITLQTFALFLIAGFAGMRMAFEVTLVWLLMAAIGLPVLSDGAGGLDAFAGPTAGYLVGMLAAAPLAGRFAELKLSFPVLFAGFFLAHLVVLGFGWAWLSVQMGARAAFDAGVAPFALGAVLKSAAAALLVTLATYRRRPA